jgi:hypothetical protein
METIESKGLESGSMELLQIQLYQSRVQCIFTDLSPKHGLKQMIGHLSILFSHPMSFHFDSPALGLSARSFPAEQFRFK